MNWRDGLHWLHVRHESRTFEGSGCAGLDNVMNSRPMMRRRRMTTTTTTTTMMMMMMMRRRRMVLE